MKIHKITHSEIIISGWYVWKPNKPINQNLIKLPKVVGPTNKKRCYKTLGTSVINSPMSPPSLEESRN